MTLNMENAYSSIVAMDWESAGVFGTETTKVDRNPMIAGAGNYTMDTGCALPPGEYTGIDLLTHTNTHSTGIGLHTPAHQGSKILVLGGGSIIEGKLWAEK